MEIKSQYDHFDLLGKNITSIFTTDLVCRLNLTLDGMRSAIDFFIANWGILKMHYAPAIVGASILFSLYISQPPTLKRIKMVMDHFKISLASMQCCIYHVVRERGIPVAYGVKELERLIPMHAEFLVSQQPKLLTNLSA